MSALPVVDPADFLPAPTAIASLSYEALFAAWQAKFAQLWPDYDVGSLETDPGAILAQAGSYVQLDTRQRVNDAYRALRLACATGSNIDGLAADLGLLRIVYVTATQTTAALVETDAELRVRCWTFQQRSARGGSILGVKNVAQVLAAPDAADVDVYDLPGQGRMRCILLPAPGLDAPGQAAMLARVSQGLMARDRRLGSVCIDTILAEVLTKDLDIALGVQPGASESAVVAAADAAVRAYMDSTRRIGARVALSRIQGDACTTNVLYAHVNGMTEDLLPGRDQAFQLGNLTVTTERVRG